ncbi:hypothetical protein C8R43DRAFT_965696 [Mycena crocata]|nr:hypothetical protein C8R43DRAFT_965696 [Mycena crocata]
MEGGGYGQVGQTVALFIFAAYASIACNYDAMTKYFNAVHDFKSEFNVVFAPRVGLQAKFTTKHRVLNMYNDLMDRVNGNILRTAEMLRQRWTFSIPNPFIRDNEQHLDFHQHLEQQNNEFQNGFSMPQASGSMWKFVFFIPPGRVLHEEIHQEFHKAMQQARLPKLLLISAISGFFDGIGDWSGEERSLRDEWDVPLWVKTCGMSHCLKKRWDIPNVGEIWWDVPLSAEIWWDIPGCVQIA